MKYIVEISDQDSHSFNVALNLPLKLKDATTENSESFWHVLDDGYIAVHRGRCDATKIPLATRQREGYDGWNVRLKDLVDESSGWRYGTIKLVMSISNMFDPHGKVRSSGTGVLVHYSIKMNHGVVHWNIIE